MKLSLLLFVVVLCFVGTHAQRKCDACDTTEWDGCNVCDCSRDPPICTLRACRADQILDQPICLVNRVNERCPAHCDAFNNGCQSCKCEDGYMVCNNVQCVRKGPEFCIRCSVQGMEWNDCGSVCTKTCDNPDPDCILVCSPRCECPCPTQIFHEGECIDRQACPVMCEPDGCSSFFDGCHTCTCGDDGYTSACTRNYCDSCRGWVEPGCLACRRPRRLKDVDELCYCENGRVACNDFAGEACACPRRRRKYYNAETNRCMSRRQCRQSGSE